MSKLLAVMKDCGYIKKDKKNAFHGYTYASEAAIKERLHQSLIAHGLLFTTSVIGFSDRPVTVGKDQKTEYVTLATMAFEFHDVETGECIGGQFYGSGVDGADKGIYKAYTGAIKYILTSWFLIPTGDDPEAEYEKKKGRGAKDPEPETVQRNTVQEQREFATRRIEQVKAVQPTTPIDPADARTASLVEIQRGFDPAKWKSTVLPHFKAIKVAMVDLRGEAGDARYYEILGAWNAKKATDFEGRIPDARMCYEELWKQVIEWEPKGE